MRSMTGFGSATLEKGPLSLRSEVRAVNHRYLQIRVRLPPELAFAESEVEELVRGRIERGSVTVNASVAGTAPDAARALNSEMAKRYKREALGLARELALPGELDLRTLLMLPGVVESGSDARVLEREAKLLLQVVGRSLDALEGMRKAEGKALSLELKRLARQIGALVAKIEKRMPQVVASHHESLKKRVEELLGARASLAPADLAREIALLADKLDVTEELSRLRSHLAQLEGLLGQDGAVGKRLEFLVQEFLREANTVGSKCNDAEVAHLVVDLKTAIERLREQVQNVE